MGDHPVEKVSPMVDWSMIERLLAAERAMKLALDALVGRLETEREEARSPGVRAVLTRTLNRVEQERL